MNGSFLTLVIKSLSALMFVLSFQASHAGELKLAIANSTCDAFEKAGDLYRANNDVQITYICKSSGLLAKGLLGGAMTADLFVSADREWMDFAVEQGLVSEKLVTSPWGNTLVLAIPKNSPLKIRRWEDLASDKVTTILIGDPSTAPFGRYGKQALESTGLWERVKDKITTRKNITLLAESLGSADSGTVGILFKSNLTEQLQEVFSVKKSWHQPIRYYMAPLKSAAGNEDVARFLKFLESRPVTDIFLAERFDVSPM